MLNAIAKPFGMLLLWLYNLVGNYGVAIFLFTVVVKLIMLPFQYKSQKGMMRMQALNPQIQELQKRHEGNQQRLQQEISKLYKEEKVNPMSGCLWMLIPYPILIALYYAIRYPLTIMMGVDAATLAEGGVLWNNLPEALRSGNAGFIQLQQSQYITEHWDAFSALNVQNLVRIDYSFLGLNLGDTPTLRFWLNGVTWASIGLFLIPAISALLSWLQMKLSQATNPTANMQQQKDQAQSLQTMNLMMPLISLWICFTMPAAMGLYWIFTSLLAIVQSVVLNRHFAKILAVETAEREARMKERQSEWDRKREETERLRAEGLTRENTSTSKKKQQARQKAELDELKAAAIREERAAKRARRGIALEKEEIPPSQVGNRRYARGRAYVPDRFTNPEGAAEATARAAAASEDAPPIDEDMPEERPDAVAAIGEPAPAGDFSEPPEDTTDLEEDDLDDTDAGETEMDEDAEPDGEEADDEE